MTNEKKSIFILSLVSMALLLASSLTAIARDDRGKPYTFTSLPGEQVQVYGGGGLYQFDNTYKAIGFRSFDWVSLVVVLPLFAVSLIQFRNGGLRGQMLLAALFTYLAYIYLIGIMGNTFNALFLVWTALFSVGLFGLVLTLRGVNVDALPAKLEGCFPRRSVAVYVIIVGLVLAAQYLVEILSAYTTGAPPAALDHYTTLELAAVELAVMVPLHIVGGLQLWRKKPWGYLISSVLVFTSVMVFIALTLSLALFRWNFGRGNPVDMAITAAITLAAVGFAIAIFRRLPG
ncbi:MAG: hypothetical protein AB9891_06370 [Anaerolineaceae bacterium]